FDGERFKRSAHQQRLSDNYMTPRSGQAVRADTNFDAMVVHRAIVTTLHIVFARPDEFDWRATQPLCDHGGFALNVRVRHGASSKSAARHLGVESDLIGF